MQQSRNRPARTATPLRWLIPAVALYLGLVSRPDSVRTAPASILEPVTAAASAANSRALNASSTTMRRTRLVRVNLSPLPTPGTRARTTEDNVELELFPGITLQAVFERFETIAGSGTWVGHIEGAPLSSVTLAYRDGLLNASINVGGLSFLIQPAPDGGPDAARPLHIVSEIDPAAVPSGPDTVEAPASPREFVEIPPGRRLDSGEVVDLMVVYTPAAQARAGGPGGIAASIAGQVAETNAALANSRMNQRIRLVHTALVDYRESPDFFRNMTDLLGGTGGLAGVAALRNAHGADLVSLLVEILPGANACGVGHLSTHPGFGERFGATVLGDAQCRSVYVMAHELGHNFGARHDWYVDPSPVPFSFGHGYVDTAARVRTIMSYNDICVSQGFSCPPINYFSSPELDYVRFCSDPRFNCDLLRYWFFPGQPIGAPETAGVGCRLRVVPEAPCAADNRRLIADTAFTVANYRQSR